MSTVLLIFVCSFDNAEANGVNGVGGRRCRRAMFASVFVCSGCLMVVAFYVFS